MEPTTDDGSALDRAPKALDERSVRAERKRANDIRSAVRVARLDDGIAEDLIERGVPIEQAREHVIDELARRSPKIDGTLRTEVGFSNDDPNVMRERMAEVVANRLNPMVPLSDAARDFAGMSLLDMGATILRGRGLLGRTTPSKAILERSIMSSGTSDFPSLMSAAAGKALLAAYEAAPSGIKPAARERTATDFKTLTSIRVGEFPALEKVPEKGEVPHGGVAEAAETFKVETFARIFALSRPAIVNDDLGAFGDFTRMAGIAAASKEAEVLFTLLNSNPAMSDGTTLFHADHGNLVGTGGGISVETVAVARQKLRSMKGLDGVTPINADPRYLIVGPSMETAAEQVLAEVWAAKVSDVNPFGKGLNLLVEPRITGNEWYLVADARIVPAIEYAYLDQARGPQVMTREGFDIMGLEVRVSLDFGAGLIDWRGIVKNPGS